VPGAARIPTTLLQVLLDYIVLNRPVGEAIGDTRFHYAIAWKKGDVDTFEAEDSFPPGTLARLKAAGWKIDVSETAGRGRHFGGVNAVKFAPDGGLTGYPDPRRTNTALGY
jgi:gamma-glutamyltranspeptidase